MDLQNPTKKYYQDENTVYSCQYHIIFTPKYRRKALIEGIDERLKELIIEKQEELNFKIIEMEVMPDHVHLLIESHPANNIKNIVGKLKGYSANILRTEFPKLKSKLPSLWTRSCFISTVGNVSLETINDYFESQKDV